MRNRFTRACSVLAAGIAVATTLGLTAAGAASASTHHVTPNATPPCHFFCINPYNAQYGPFFVLQNHNARNAVGNKLVLEPASNTKPGEDWTIYFQGSVRWFFLHGLVSANLDLHYRHEPAYELQWSPYGVNTGLCQGTAAPAFNREKVSLQVCGNNANTVWVLDFRDATPHVGFVPVIAGSTTNFSQPQVLTTSGAPWQSNQPPLITYRLQTFADGTVYDTQEWWAFPGEIGPAI